MIASGASLAAVKPARGGGGLTLDVPTDWWRTFFSGLFVELWLAAPPEEQTRQEADFVQEALGVSPPAWLLDVPCGGGRHSHELAGQGFAMTGVDISPDFLAAARARTPAAAAVPAIAWEERPMHTLPWTEAFDGAFCLGNSFGYDDEAGNAAFLKAVARGLKPGARFVLETSYVAEVLLPSLQERAWYRVGELLMLADRSYDPPTGRLRVEYTLIQGAASERRAMSARLYTYREVVRLLEQAGFGDLQAYGSFAKEPFRLGSPRLVAVATRRPG
jgi:SAM-dependent methyltransferase